MPTSFAVPFTQAVGPTGSSQPPLTKGALATLYRHTERDRQGGYFPVAVGTTWHGGIHLHMAQGSLVCSVADGKLIAVRLGEEDKANHHYGSHNFALVQHTDKLGDYFALYMHLNWEPLQADSAVLKRLAWLQDKDGAPDAALLKKLKEGKVVKLDKPVAVGDPLWTSGLYGSKTPLKDYQTGMIHWEIFSEKLLRTDFRQAEDGDNDFHCDNAAIASYLGNILDTDKDGNWELDEIIAFYKDPKRSADLRYTACKFICEFAVDWSKAIGKIRDGELSFGSWVSQLWTSDDEIAGRIQKYNFWQEALDVGVPLPRDPHVWHYNPIAFFESQIIQVPCTLEYPPATPSPHKQYVNLKDNDKDHGSTLRVRLKIERPGFDGRSVHWKLTADANNSKRTKPEPGLKATKDGELQKLDRATSKCVSKVNGQYADVYVALGVSGGDKYTIEGSFEGDPKIYKVEVETWRKLRYEMWQPSATGPDRLTDFTVFDPGKSPGLAPDTKTYMKEVLDEVFVEFEQAKAANFSKADVPLNGAHNVFDGAYLSTTPGNKALVMSMDQAKQILNAKSTARSEKDMITSIWVDYFVAPERWQQKVSQVFKAADGAVRDRRMVFKNAIDSHTGSLSLAHGAFTVSKLSWKATHWWNLAVGGVGGWQAIASATDPGGAFRLPTMLTNRADIEAHLKFRNAETFHIELPSGSPAYPGQALSKDAGGQLTDAGQVVGVEFSIEGVMYSANILGAAIYGDIWMNTFAGAAHPVGMGAIILHEIGHNMGQTYMSKADASTYGRAASKEIPGIPPPAAVPTGYVYDDKRGHRGPHCADGVTNRTAPKFNVAAIEAQATCLMFGSGSLASTQRKKFCAHCQPHVRAEDLSEIRGSWY